METSTLLSVHSANKSYNNIPALIDASLELRAGEVHALIGENGAGKSTLIKLLAGVLEPDSIEITVRGQPAAFRRAQDAFDVGLRFIHQELNVVPALSVAENIVVGRPYPRRFGLFVNWAALHASAAAELQQLGVTHIAPTETMARLSPGDQMLVKIASAFAGAESASVYVMDEPTAALTGEEAAKLFAVIAEITRSGGAVLYVSHRLDEIFQIADRVTVMRDGRVVATEATRNTSPADLIRLMTGRDIQQAFPTRDDVDKVDEMAEAHAVLDAPLLSVCDLATRVVRASGFSLHEGEILGVAGLNGAGRTELLRALIGADRSRSGSITLDGAPLTHKTPSGAWQAGIAYVPEERRSQGLVLSRPVKDNIALPHLGQMSRGALFLDHRQIRESAQSIGEAVRLKAEGVNQHVWQLSGGNQQKVLFGRAMAKLPRVLLLDEPTRGVDVGAKYDIYKLIREISAAGTGIIMVSSELPELLGLCDRIIVMRAGRLVDSVPAQGMTEAELLTLCYGDIQQEQVDK